MNQTKLLIQKNSSIIITEMYIQKTKAKSFMSCRVINQRAYKVACPPNRNVSPSTVSQSFNHILGGTGVYNPDLTSPSPQWWNQGSIKNDDEREDTSRCRKRSGVSHKEYRKRERGRESKRM